MPVGTQGAVKGVGPDLLAADTRAHIVLGNTYHLYLRPGTDVLEQAGGLHAFSTWTGPMLTDSGGFQVYSLEDRRKIREEGVKFQSHIDGSTHLFSPESVMDVQRSIGADIVMAFDECTAYPIEKAYAREAMERTHRWLDRCFVRWNETEPKYGYDQALFPIVQGSTFSDLRKESAEFIASKGAWGNAIGGLSVGEPHDEMYAMTAEVCAILPADRPPLPHVGRNPRQHSRIHRVGCRYVRLRDADPQRPQRPTIYPPRNRQPPQREVGPRLQSA